MLMGYTSCLEPHFMLHQGKTMLILWAKLEAGSEQKLILENTSGSTKVGFCDRKQPLKDLLHHTPDEDDDLGMFTED